MTLPAPRPPNTERTIRCLQVGQLLRSSQWAFTNTAQTAIALQLTQGDHARVVQLLSVSTTVSTFLEMVITPWIGALCDRCGRKPLLIAASMAKFVPYISNALSPSLVAMCAEAVFGA